MDRSAPVGTGRSARRPASPAKPIDVTSLPAWL